MKLPHQKLSLAKKGLIGVTIILVAGALLTIVFQLATPKPQTPVRDSASEMVPPTIQTPQLRHFSATPERIDIEKIGVSAPIISVGLTRDGNMEAPVTLTDVGWYRQSAPLGANSAYALLMDGHYGSDAAPGVFYRLHELSEGDIIRVGGENESAEFTVKEIERRTLEAVDMKKAFEVYHGDEQSLTLITCQGDYDASRATYNDRIVVYAVRTK